MVVPRLQRGMVNDFTGYTTIKNVPTSDWRDRVAEHVAGVLEAEHEHLEVLVTAAVALQAFDQLDQLTVLVVDGQPATVASMLP